MVRWNTSAAYRAGLKSWRTADFCAHSDLLIDLQFAHAISMFLVLSLLLAVHVLAESVNTVETCCYP